MTNEELLNELTSAAEEQFRLKRNTVRYANALAAVLARMAGPGEVVVKQDKPMLILCFESEVDRDGMRELIHAMQGIATVTARPNNGGNDDQAR